MKFSIGCDHAGPVYKKTITDHLEKLGHSVVNRGTDTEESVDYPDHAHAVAEDVESGNSDLGILICGSANGVSMTANKHQTIRAGIAWTPEIAELARTHNNANVICIPARFISEETAVAARHTRSRANAARSTSQGCPTAPPTGRAAPQPLRAARTTHK